MSSTVEEFSGYSPTWCPGCGDWGIGSAIKRAFVDLGLTPSSLRVVFGIGCSGNMNDFLNAYAIHGLHGRALANAIGLKLSQHEKQVVAIVGDGDCYGEGGNHFLHACRGNHDMTVVVHDNSVYGLTTGQVSPRAKKGALSKSTPHGLIEMPMNPLSLAVSQGATFVSQSFAGDVTHVIEMVKKAMSHKGFALVNVLQPCVTFNKVNTYEYYREKTYYLGEDYDRHNFDWALTKGAEPTKDEKFPLGVIYEAHPEAKRPAYHEEVVQLKEGELIAKKRFIDFESLYSPFE